jgi:hypothetical protein
MTVCRVEAEGMQLGPSVVVVAVVRAAVGGSYGVAQQLVSLVTKFKYGRN